MSTIEADTDSSPPPPLRNHRFTMAGDSALPETYHLDGGGNFGMWSYRMKSLLQKDSRFHYCTTPPSKVMSEEEKLARQQVMSIICSNAKNSALKLLRRYSDPYECWTGLKSRYESDSGPRRVMLLEKFFAMRKTDSISMDTHLTEVREVVNLLEEVEVNMSEEVIVFYTLKNLPKEYEIFKRMQIAAQKLPTYEQLEAKLISEETALKMENQRADGEALFVHHDRNRRPQHGSVSRPQNSPAAYNSRFSQNSRWRSDSGSFSGTRPFNQDDQGGPSRYQQLPAVANQRSAPPTQHQPRYRNRGPQRPRNETCNFCGLTGHFERECDLRSILDRLKDYEHRLNEQRQRNLNGQVHHLEEPSESFSLNPPPNDEETADQIVDACLMELNLLETPPNTTSWYLDSGATHHVSGEQSAFSSIRSTSGAQVKSAGGHSHPVAGVGNVELHFSSGAIKSINSVLYTPGITKNLLSVGALTDQSKTLVFKSDGCFIFDNSTLKLEAVASREHRHGLYRLSSLSPLPEVNLLQNTNAELWHKRLGHFHAKGMQRMLHHGAVRGLPALQFSKHPCTGCQLGKQARTKLPKVATFQATKILQLVHSDVCGPFRTNSLGGARYFVTFIDDFSRKTWVYFLTNKDQVLTKFQHLVSFLKNSTGHLIQTLRTDNGGEYTSHAFREYCLNNGIAREFAPPYTPQRNGVAVRRNRSLLDITRSLLIDKALPGHLWAEAVKAACDLLNLRSTKKHPDKTPEELFSGKKPSISHLKVFGSPAYVYNTNPTRSKLDPRSERCILLSFDWEAKAYRCYRSSTKKVFISRNVVADEFSPDLPTREDALTAREDTLSDPTPAPTRHAERLATMDSTLPPTLDGTTTPLSTPDASINSPVSPVISPISSPSTPTRSHTDHGSPLQVSHSPEPSQSPDSLPTPSLQLPRRSERVRKFPQHLQDFAATVQLQHFDDPTEDSTELLTHQQALRNPLWQSAMQAEMDSIQSNRTWSLVPLPPDKKAISSKWVYKIKPGTPGNPTRYKARLVARGFQQKDGVDFLETFAPVVRWETIRVLIAIAVHLNWPLHQLDFLTAFLNGILKEDVYMFQPPGFAIPGAEHLVCKLHKALYGLKQSPRAWYARLHAALLAWGLIQSLADPNLYFAHVGPDTVALLVYVDDILLTGSNPTLINRLKTHLQRSFKTNDLGPISRYLGVQFDRSDTGLHMHQRDYALSILRLFHMEDCKPSHTPLPEGLVLSKDSPTPPVDATLYRMLIGKLLFLTKTRPDLTHAVSVVSRFMQQPKEVHLQAAKHILRYVRRYPDLGLFFKQGEENRLHGYTDADYGQDIDDRISVGAYIFFLGNSPISWNSKKQSSTSRSSCESEYRALAQCSCEAVWIRRLLGELKILDDKPTYLYCDNQSSIKLSYNPVFHERSKHFEIDYHYTRQKIENNTIKVEYISTQEQPADILTKPLGRIKFENCRDRLYLRSLSSQAPTK